jgi:hypothetical protein
MWQEVNSVVVLWVCIQLCVSYSLALRDKTVLTLSTRADIIEYTVFCGERNGNLAACLKRFSKYSDTSADEDNSFQNHIR